MWHMDITSAFLNGVLNEMVYMHQPKGFEVVGKEKWVWKLKKVLYGHLGQPKNPIQLGGLP